MTDSDSDATIILDPSETVCEITPKPPGVKRKITGHNCQQLIKKNPHHLRNKNLCKERNDHFKLKHRKLQCRKCKKFFCTPSAFLLHRYVHAKEQFECTECNVRFPFKSQLDHHMVSHSNTQRYKYTNPFVIKSLPIEVI